MKPLTLCLSAAVSLLAALPAQDPASTAKPAEDQKKDPEVVTEPTPQERVDKLRLEVQKLRGELGAIERVEQSGGLADRVKECLSTRRVVADSFEDPNPPAPPAAAMPAPQPVNKKPARLLGDAEKANLGPDVIFTVDGQPVTKAEFDGAIEYLKSYRQSEPEAALATQAVLELIRVKAAQAAFPETAPQARAKIVELQQKLAETDVDFADVARESSECPSSVQGGDLGYFGRAGMDFWFTRAAFALEVGEVSDIVPTAFGYHLIKVTAKEKGDTPAYDTVKASHILAMYGDQATLGQVSTRVNSGQVDLAFVTDEYRKYAPPAFQ